MEAAPSHCPVCFSTSWSLNDGVLVCEVCGTQSQVFVEEAQEFQVGVDDSRYRRRTRLSSTAGIKAEALTHEESPSADAIQIMMQWYCRCLQSILLEEVAVLQMQCGLGASLSSVTRRIWLGHVAVSGILTGGFARGVWKSIQSPPLQHGESRKPVWRTTLRAAAWKVLPPDTLLAVCFLGCWHLRQAITPMDILRWASDGRLPFLKLRAASAGLLEAARQADCALPALLLQPTGVTNVQDLVALAVHIASGLQMQLPPVNAGALVCRFVQDLALPEEVAALALQLVEVHMHGAVHAWLQEDVFLHPYAHIMAALVIALKLGFGLDIPGSEQGGGAGNAPVDWHGWADAVLRGCPSATPFPRTGFEAANLSDSEFDAYMEYLQKEVFAGEVMPEGLHDLFRTVKHTARPASDGNMHLPTLGSVVDRLPERQHGRYRMATLSEATQQQLLGPKYVAVLTACAAYLWLRPGFLHRVVCRVEESMGKLELDASSARVQ